MKFTEYLHDNEYMESLFRSKTLSYESPYNINELIEKNYNISKINIGFLDVTFFRDDFGRENKILSANKTSIDFIVEDKIVILVDDVLYTGRSIRSALTALQSFGRPKKIELLVFVDRRFTFY